MPITIPEYSVVQKPQRKRQKLDGEDSGGKPRKKTSIGVKLGTVDDTERCADQEQSEQSSTKRSGKARKKKSIGDKSGAVEDTERCSYVETDVVGDSKQPAGKKTRKPRKKKPAMEKSEAEPEVIGDSEPPPPKPPRRKRPKTSKAECRSKSENVDVASIPDEVDSVMANRKRSADRLADKLQSPLLQIIEAGDADDFEVNNVHLKEQDPHENVSLGCETVAKIAIESRSGGECCNRVKELLYDVFSSPEYSAGVDQTNVNALSSYHRARVQTPPTFEETSAAMQAMEKAGRLSPVDIMELVDHWKREMSKKSEFTSHNAVSNEDDELPAFGMALKPCRKVLGGRENLLGSELTDIDAGKVRSDVHTVDLCSKLSVERSSPTGCKPLQKVAEAFISVDESSDFSDFEGNEEELRMLDAFEKGLDSRLPDVATNADWTSVNIPLKNPAKTPGRQAGDVKIPDDESRNANFGFSHHRDISVVASSHRESEQRGFCDDVLDKKLPNYQILAAVDEFSQFDDTNDDQLLAAAVATPVPQHNSYRIPIVEKSSNVTGLNLADNSQLTFTQALACLHDSIDVSRVPAESPGIHGRSRKAEYREENLTKVDKPHFDLGFELSDDDDDDDDIIPPSPPLSSSLKSGTRPGSRASSLITISRQNSFGSHFISGPGAGKPVEVATGTDCTNIHKTELVRNQSSVGTIFFSNLSSSAGPPSPRMVSKNLISEAAAVEQKSRDNAPVCQSGTRLMEKKSRVGELISELNSGAVDQKSQDLLSAAVQSRTVQKSRNQAVVVDDKSTDPTHSSHVAVIHPCVRSLAMPTALDDQSEMRLLATPTALANQSEMISPPSALAASTPFKPHLNEKCEFLLLFLLHILLYLLFVFIFIFLLFLFLFTR